MGLALPLIRVAGTPREMGLAYGRAVGARARAFVDERRRAAAAYLRERGVRDGGRLEALARECLAALQAWHRAGWEEHVATAEGAGIDAVALYAAANYTDLRDIIAYPDAPAAVRSGSSAGSSADAEGCTEVLLPGASAADGAVIAAQTWDLNPGDIDYVVAVHRRPAQGAATWSITCAGSPSLIGMNAHALAVGTTNIKTRGARVGIPYLSLLHRALACETRAAAVAAIGGAPRAAAHTYWFADARGAEDMECTATRAVSRQAVAPVARTNHCLDADNQAVEAEPASSSSRARLARAGAAFAGGGATVDAVRALFADRGDGVDSVNRRPQHAKATPTNACMIAVPARREQHACRAPADRGEWVRLPFD